MPFFRSFLKKAELWFAVFTDFLREKLQPAVQELLEKIPQDKRKIVLLLGAASLVLLLLAVILQVNTSDNRNRGGPQDAVLQQIIPITDIFLPEEPVFVPGVLLEREQRPDWDYEDAGDFWRDPLQYGEEIWRGRVQTMIDQFLEHIP